MRLALFATLVLGILLESLSMFAKIVGTGASESCESCAHSPWWSTPGIVLALILIVGSAVLLGLMSDD